MLEFLGFYLIINFGGFDTTMICIHHFNMIMFTFSDILPNKKALLIDIREENRH
jgi:hypothetical protein